MERVLLYFGIGALEVIAVGLLVRFWPGQEDPQGNATLAMVACGLGYSLCLFLLNLLKGCH